MLGRRRNITVVSDMDTRRTNVTVGALYTGDGRLLPILGLLFVPVTECVRFAMLRVFVALVMRMLIASNS